MDRAAMLSMRVWRLVVAAIALVALGLLGGGMSTAAAAVPGVDWTSRTSAADNEWNSVAYGNGLFVAVASAGTGDRVMTSPEGITWT